MGEKPRMEDEADERQGGTMSSIQNIKREGGEGSGADAGDLGNEARTSNLNLSKSNIDREAGGEGGDGPPQPVEGASINASKSNNF